MLLRELRHHFQSGDLESAVAVLSPNRDEYYLMVKSHKWGINSFLETGRTQKPRAFKTQLALLKVARSIGFNHHSIEVKHL